MLYTDPVNCSFRYENIWQISGEDIGEYGFNTASFPGHA